MLKPSSAPCPRNFRHWAKRSRVAGSNAAMALFTMAHERWVYARLKDHIRRAFDREILGACLGC